MRVFADSVRDDFAIKRISSAIKRYSPLGIEFVDTEDEAELVIVYAFGQRRAVWYRVDKLMKMGKKYAVVQLALKSTRNPNSDDWLKIWNHSIGVWSYLDLPIDYYKAPLGVDTQIFKDYGKDRVYLIAHGTNRDESVNEIREASIAVKGVPFGIGLGGLSDQDLSMFYSKCKYVSGLRRIEGFEMPVIEGLMCGARPICYDKPHYRQWFGEIPIYIPEGSHNQVINCLKLIFQGTVRPVSDYEKEVISQKFNWETIIKGFWKEII